MHDHCNHGTHVSCKQDHSCSIFLEKWQGSKPCSPKPTQPNVGISPCLKTSHFSWVQGKQEVYSMVSDEERGAYVRISECSWMNTPLKLIVANITFPCIDIVNSRCKHGIATKKLRTPLLRKYNSIAIPWCVVLQVIVSTFVGAGFEIICHAYDGFVLCYFE